MRIHTSHQQRLVLLLLMNDLDEIWPSTAVARALNLKASTAWENLRRLVTAGWAETFTVDGDPRRYPHYQLTERGTQRAREILEEFADNEELIRDARAAELSIKDVLAGSHREPAQTEYERAVARLLGLQIKLERKKLGWTRRELVDVMNGIISLQTMATYEHGTRMMSVARLFQIGEALGKYPHTLLINTEAGINYGIAQDGLDDHPLCLDLNKLANCDRADLAPV